eukprot:g45281.t1
MSGNATYQLSGQSLLDLAGLTGLTLDKVVQRHKDFYEQTASITPQHCKTLPYIYFPVKAHKGPPKDARYITSCRDCSLRGIGVILNLGFRELEPSATHYGIISSKSTTCHVSQILNSLTSLPLPQLINRLSNYIRVAYLLKYNIDRFTHLYFCFNNHTHSYNPPVLCSYPPQAKKPTIPFSTRSLLSTTSPSKSNSFIAFGELVLQQTVGIPMGVNDGVHQANNFLFTYEFGFFLQLINLYRIPLIHSFALTERFLDDLLSLNNPDFNKYRYNLRSLQHAKIQGIYPHPELKVEIEHDTAPQVRRTKQTLLR